MHYRVNPETCGHFGRKVLYGGNLDAVPPQIYRMHHEFDSYPKDKLFEISRLYICTEELVQLLRTLAPPPSGIQFEDMIVSTTLEFRRANPETDPPSCRWMKVVGKPGVDDFGMSGDHCLVVSERVLELVKPMIEHTKVAIFIRGDAEAKA